MNPSEHRVNIIEIKEQIQKKRMECFHGSRYWYPTPDDGTACIGVFQGAVGVWIVGYVRENGARKRIKSVYLPVMTDPEDLQLKLDQWANHHDLKEVI